MSEKYEAIIFDAGGVLFYIREFRSSIIQRVLRSRGYSDDVISAALAQAGEHDKRYFRENRIVTWQDEKNWLNARAGWLAEFLKVDSALRDQLYHLCLDTFQYTLYEETISVLQSLHGQLPLYVLSNATATLDWAFDYLGLRPFFEDVIISAYVEDEKPSASIFELSISRFDVHAEKTLFIDDRIENIVAANKCGLTGIHLDRKAGKTLEVLADYLS